MTHSNKFYTASHSRLGSIAVLIAMVGSIAVAPPTANAKPKHGCDAEAAEETGCIQSPTHTGADKSHTKTVRSASPASRAASTARAKPTTAAPAPAATELKAK